MTAADRRAPDELGGDAVCWAHLLCPECGAIPDPGEEDLDAAPGAGRNDPLRKDPRQIAKVGGDTAGARVTG